MRRHAWKGEVLDYELDIDEERFELVNQPAPQTEVSLMPVLKPQYNRRKKVLKRRRL